MRYGAILGRMDAQSPRHKSSNLTAFVTSFSAAIVVGLALAILAQAFIFSIAHLMGLGSTSLWVASIINAIFFGVGLCLDLRAFLAC